MNPTEARKRIVQTYHQTGNSCETARRWNTSPQRVRKGVQRYQQHGEAGLLDQPRTPKRQPRKTAPDREPRVLQLLTCRALGGLGRVKAFLGAGLGWLYHYNYERVHFGDGLEGRTLDGCCMALGYKGSAYVGLMPVVLLDEMVLDWLRAGLPAVNDVLAHYSSLCV
jgi:transposase-like protein